jgi:hypothetical protein
VSRSAENLPATICGFPGGSLGEGVGPRRVEHDRVRDAPRVLGLDLALTAERARRSWAGRPRRITGEHLVQPSSLFSTGTATIREIVFHQYAERLSLEGIVNKLLC